MIERRPGSLGMIVRADSGGLGSQLFECWRHLRPELTLVVQMGDDARGPEDLGRYGLPSETVWIARRHCTPQILADFASRVANVFVIESPYCQNGMDVMRQAGARVVLLANPELYAPYDHGMPSELYVPTHWNLCPGDDPAGHLPQPVALDRFPYRPVRDACRVFVHQTAPAMLDRNGTRTVLRACEMVTEPCVLVITGRLGANVPGPLPQKIGVVRIQHRDTFHENYWDAWPEEGDCLLSPRRYGGLSLPVLEAAAQGMPSLMSGVMPQMTWPSVVSVPTDGRDTVPMKGGPVYVWSVNPGALAMAMDACVQDRNWADRSRAAYSWAVDNSWGTLLPLWQEVLRGA